MRINIGRTLFEKFWNSHLWTIILLKNFLSKLKYQWCIEIMIYIYACNASSRVSNAKLLLYSNANIPGIVLSFNCLGKRNFTFRDDKYLKKLMELSTLKNFKLHSFSSLFVYLVKSYLCTLKDCQECFLVDITFHGSSQHFISFWIFMFNS